MKRSAGELQDLLKRREDLQRSIAALGDLRPGHLSERYRRCGKPNCHCAEPGDPGHGPCWSLTRRVDGKTVTRVIPKGLAVEATQAQLAEYRHWCQLSDELVEINVAICDARLDQSRAASDQDEKKGSAVP